MLAASASVWSMLFGYVLLPRECLGGVEMVGLIVGFVRVAVLVLPQLGTGPVITQVGSLFMVAAVLSFSAGGALVPRGVPVEPTLWTVAIHFAVASALVTVIVLAIGEPRTLRDSSATLSAPAYLVVSSRPCPTFSTSAFTTGSDSFARTWSSTRPR